MGGSDDSRPRPWWATADGTAAQTQTYSRPAPGSNAVRPHAVTSVTATGRSAGTSNYTGDASGNMTGRNLARQAPQQLGWDVEGELAQTLQDNNGDGDTSDANERDSYVYTADGDRVLRTQDGATTLYLGYQELTLNHGTGATTAQRYYAFAGQTVATRTGYYLADVTSIIGDHHNTSSVQIPNVAGPAKRVHRYTDPYGKARGPHDRDGASDGADGVWIGEHGYLDRPIDTTGLTAIGARMYDAAIGAFISVDPIMDLADPQQWNGYAYSHNNPTTFSDPTGEREMCETGWTCNYGHGGNITKAKKKPKPKPTIWDLRSRVLQSWGVSANSVPLRKAVYREFGYPGRKNLFLASSYARVEAAEMRERARAEKLWFAQKTVELAKLNQARADAANRASIAGARRDGATTQGNASGCAVLCIDVARGSNKQTQYFSLAGGYGPELGVSAGSSYATAPTAGWSKGAPLTAAGPVGVTGSMTVGDGIMDDSMRVTGGSFGPVGAYGAKVGAHMWVGYTWTWR